MFYRLLGLCEKSPFAWPGEKEVRVRSSLFEGFGPRYASRVEGLQSEPDSGVGA